MDITKLGKADKGEMPGSDNIEFPVEDPPMKDFKLTKQYEIRKQILDQQTGSYGNWGSWGTAAHENSGEIYRRLLQTRDPSVVPGGVWGDGLHPITPSRDFQPAAMSVDTPTDNSDKWELSFADPRANLPEKRLQQRAAKAGVSLGEDPEKLKIEMSDAQGEAQVRQRASYKNAAEFQQAKQAYIDEVLKTRDPSNPMTLEEATHISNMTQEEFNSLDPDAMEKMYSQKIVRQLSGSHPTSTKALTENPETYHNIQDAAEQGVQKQEVALRFVEDRRREYDTQTGIVGKIWNTFEQFIPFKTQLTQYDTEMQSWLPGNNMADQVRSLWLLPPAQFSAKLEEGYALIAAHNPQDALDWAESVLSYSRMSSGTANVMFGVDVATTVPFGSLLKLVKGAEVAGKAVQGATKAATDAERLKQGFKIVTEGEGPRVRTDKELINQGWSVQEAGKVPTDEERLLDGWTIGEVDFPDDFRAAVAAQDTTRALGKEEQIAEETLAKTGNQEQAIDVSVQKQIDEAGKNVDVRDPSEFVNTTNKLDGMYNPRAWLDGGSRLTREAADRIMSTVNSARLKFTEAVANPGQALRLTEGALAKAVDLAKRRMRDEFRFANDGIIDTRWKVITQDENPDSQLNQLVVTMGTPDGLAFNSEEFARQTADHLYMLRKGDYQVEQVGNEFYLNVTRPLDERDAAVAQAMIETGNETPRSLANTILGWFRNPDDLLSQFSRSNRKAVTGSGQSLQNYFADAVKTIGNLTKNQKSRLDQMMTINRDWVDGQTRGRWFDSAGEYEQRYYDTFKQYPTEAETAAYMLTREISDFDWSVRSLTILRDKSRQGIVNVHSRVRVLEPQRGEVDWAAELQAKGDLEFRGEADQNVYRYEDVSFEGKLLEALPDSKPGDGDPGVYIIKEGDSVGEWKPLSEVNREDLRQLVEEQGYKIYQQSNGLNNPFKAIDQNGWDRQFVIMKNAQTSALRAEDMLPYRAGYHVEYAPGFYTKAGKFFRDGRGRFSYGGDTSIMYHVSQAAARKYTSAFENARKLLKEGKTDDLKAYLAGNLPHTYDDFVRMYSDGTLDIDTPVMYTRSGQSTKDSARTGQGNFELYNSARDAYNSPYNLETQVNHQYAQEKDLALPSVTKGSEGNPIHSFVPAKMISPLSNLSRNMHNMVRMRAYDNYQYQALTSLVEEFANPETLGGSVTKRSLESIRNNPLAFITDPMWDTKTLNRDKLAAAKNAHRAIVNLLGVQSEVNKNVDWFLNKVVDSVFDRWGDGAASKVSDFLHTAIKDPSRYARSIAFHAKLGLFNPVQLFLQAQSVVHGAAITGSLTRSYQAMGAGMLMRYLSLTTDEGIVKSFARKAKVFGWSENDFMESFDNMKAAGIWHVEGEVADLNDIFGAQMFRGRGRQFLDKGTMFFQEGERIVRLNAWNTAYKEWKLANPLKAIGNRERNEILRRYDDLAINMTRSSTGAWQQGILSIPAQFSTYQVHLMEQMLGKRLTTAEKTRVLAAYSALYGVPTGIAAGTAFWPWGQDIKQAAMERGIDTNDGVIDVLMNGIMSASFEAITGREYAMSERYGPNGLTIFKEALSGKKGILDALVGPSGQIIGDLIGATDPVARAVTGIFTGDNSQYPLAPEDFAAFFRNISTVNNAFQMYYAMNAGKFMSKNELFTSEADGMDAIMKGIFGLDSREMSDAYIKIESMAEFKEAQEHAEKEFIKQYRRALENFQDPEAFKLYMNGAKTWLIAGGFRPDQISRLIQRATNGNTSLIDNIERQWIKYAPAQDIEMRWQQHQQRNQ